MQIREAGIDDIRGMQIVRNLVKENRLSNPALVPDADVEDYILHRGKGWVCEIDEEIRGFSIVSLADKNIWALFLDPLFERKGIGRQLHDVMVNWYFEQTFETLWLGTAPATRAERFYRKAGWKETGIHGKGEIRFEMTAGDWFNRI